MKNLHVWVQKVLPLVYDDSLSYYEVLSKIVDKTNEIIKLFNDIDGEIYNDVAEILTPDFVAGVITQEYFNTWLSENTSFTDLQTQVAQNTHDIGLNANEIIALGNRVDEKAPINSPVFTGVPQTPNVAVSDNSGKIANTKYINDFYNDKFNTQSTYYTNATPVIGWSFKKIGNVVECNTSAILRVTNDQSITVCDAIPADYRPMSDFCIPTVFIASSVVVGYGIIYVSTSGRMLMFSSYTGNTEFQVHANWLSA